MSGERKCCDPEVVFELADGALPPNRKREVASHLEDCPGCRDHYEKEKALSESLCSMGDVEVPSVCREVAMALPTRSMKARFLWAALAAGIFVSAALALALNGSAPLAMASGPLEVFWGVGSGIADVAAMLISFAAPAIIVALAVGAILDILVAGFVFSALRGRRATSETRRA